MTSWTEEWRDVPGYAGLYQVSNLGRVRSCSRLIERKNGHPLPLQSRILKPRLSHKGYLLVSLCKGSKQKNVSAHRIVAEAFIPNPEGKPEVNHRNGDKTDNRVENLEWVTSKENTRHSIDVLGNARNKPKYAVVCLDTGVTYSSAREAARATGCGYSGITAVCRHEKLRHHGLRWAYKEADA